MLAYSILDHNEEMGSSDGVDDEKNTHDGLPSRKDCGTIQKPPECCGF
jgi:hypothetical protein